MLEGYPLGPILGSDQCTLIPSPRPDLDGSLTFLVAAMFIILYSVVHTIKKDIYENLLRGAIWDSGLKIFY